MTRLTVADADLSAGALRLYGKGDKERIVPLGRQAVYWLEKYLREARPQLAKENQTAALWISSRGGGPLGYEAMQQQLRGYAHRLGLPVSLLAAHNLRRACATHLLGHGASPLLLQKLLGHVRTATLSHYLRRSLADLKETHRRSFARRMNYENTSRLAGIPSGLRARVAAEPLHRAHARLSRTAIFWTGWKLITA